MIDERCPVYAKRTSHFTTPFEDFFPEIVVSSYFAALVFFSEKSMTQSFGMRYAYPTWNYLSLPKYKSW